MSLAVYALTALIVINLISTSTWATAFNFNFNWLSAVYLLSILVAVALILVIKQKIQGNRIAFWFIIYVTAVAAYMLANLLKGASADLATYGFWYPIVNFTGIMVAPIFLVFVLHYTDRQDLFYRPLTWLAVFGTTYLVIPISAKGTSVANPAEAMRYSFGYPSIAPFSSGQIFVVLIALVLLVAALGLLVLHYKQVKTIPAQRTQARLFIIGGALPLTLGILTAGVLPLFKIQVPAEPIFSMFQIILIGYAIFRYRLFTIDSTALADTILSTVHESIITINTNREVEYLNPAAQHFLGKKLISTRGRQIHELFDESTANSILSRLDSHHYTSESIEFVTHVHGHKIPISMIISKIISKGSTEGYILVFRDISKERAISRDIERQVRDRTAELNDEHARLQSAMDSLDVGLLMTFKEKKEISYNASVSKILSSDKTALDAEPTELTLEWLQDKLSISKFDLLSAIAQCQKTGKSFNAKEITYGRKVLRIFGAPILLEDGHPIGAVVRLEDITEEKIAERSKDEFFSIASHELRTPLTSIKGNTSMIMQYYPEILKDEALKEMIEDVHTSSVRLIEIVNDFLDVSRLEQSKISFDYEAVNLVEVIDSVAYEMQAVMAEKKLYLRLDKKELTGLPQICADKNRLKQVIYNLLGNALKFTEEGGITLGAEIVGSMVRVEVTDTGRGMTADSQKLLFHKFQQASSSLLTRDTTRGTGLGLYISKMIVENMGGAILLLQSKEGVGTTFAFTVPIATPKRLKEMDNLIGQTDVKTGLTTKKV